MDLGFTHRPLSSSLFYVFYVDPYKVIPKKKLLRGLWVCCMGFEFGCVGLTVRGKLLSAKKPW